MGLYNKLPDGLHEVDVVIAGGKCIHHTLYQLSYTIGAY